MSISILFSAACGNSNSGTNVPVKGSFTNASLSGQYAYVLSGTYFGTSVTNGAFHEAGTFTADGNGNVTSGADDFVQGAAPFSSTLTGTYSLNNDGTGFVTLNFAGGGSVVLAVSLVTDSKLYLVEADSFANGAGMAERQDATAFSAAPSGTFTFRTHSSSTSGGSVGSVGALTASGGAITGTEDVIRASALVSPTLTGSIGAPNTSGRGTMSLTDSTGSTASYIYYVVNASTFNLLESDAGPLGSGRAEKQTGGPFTTASLTGGFAFGSTGDTAANTGGVDTVGAFSSNGSGTITAGSLDAVQDGNATANATFTGTYTMTPAGRATVGFNQSGATVQRIFWMVSPARAFFLVDSPSRVEDGTADQQTTTSFSNSTVNGQYAFFMDGFDSVSPPLVDRVGTLSGDGGGNLQLNYFVNRTGITNAPGFLTGTYSVGSNGRVAGSVSALSTNIVLYMVSSNSGYLLLGDAGSQLEGAAALQMSP